MDNNLDKILTIVVPVYNVEKYINKCLDSLVLYDSQLMESLEVIIVNDGTLDHSTELSREYVKWYPDTFRQIDKENGNYGSCINRGLTEARGKYIKILDGDDWYDTEQFGNYIESLTGVDVDMILNDYRTVSADGKTIQKFAYDFADGISFDFLKLEDVGIYFSMHSIAYRTEMLRDMAYKQTEGISYTDSEWVYYPQIEVKTCEYLKYDVYRYLIGREGQTVDSKVVRKSSDHKVKLIGSMTSFLNKLPEDKKLLNAYKRIQVFVEHIALGLYRFMLVSQPSCTFDKQLFVSFDDKIRSYDYSLYEKAGCLTFKYYLPVRFVSLWRKTGIRLGGLRCIEKFHSVRS